MTGQVPERPRATGIVGWFSIFVGVCFVLIGASAVWFAMHPEPPPNLSPQAVQMWTRMARFSGPLAGLQVAIGSVMLLASSWFLGRKEFGRTALEGLNWFGLAYTALMTARTITFYRQTFGSQEGSLLVPMEAGTAVCAVIGLAIIGLILAALRSREVRNAMRA